MDRPEHRSPQMPTVVTAGMVLLIKRVMEAHMEEESHLEEGLMSRVDSIHMDVEITDLVKSFSLNFQNTSICSLAFWHLGGGGSDGGFFIL